MTQPTPQPSPQTTQPTAAQLIASMPVSNSLSTYIQAAASGAHSSIFQLFIAVFVMARAAVRCLTEHYNNHPRQRTLATYARLKYCLSRIPAILYTLQHAPERFLSPAQLRALTRARAVLAHILRQPVDFSPLTPYLTSPENCPPPPRSAADPSLGAPLHTPRSALHSSEAPRSALRTSAADPLLLRNPGCALASVLLQLAAIYGLSTAPAPAPRPSTSASPSIPSVTPAPEDQPIVSYSTSNPPASNHSADSLSPHSALRTPHFPQPPP